MAVKTGRKEKDREITENFNPDKKDGMKREDLKEVKNKGGRPRNDSYVFNPDQMLRDMWRVYRRKGGIKILEKYCDDPKNLKIFLDQLLRAGVSIITTKIRAKEETGGRQDQAVFVVLKGLGEDVKIEGVGQTSALPPEELQAPEQWK